MLSTSDKEDGAATALKQKIFFVNRQSLAASEDVSVVEAHWRSRLVATWSRQYGLRTAYIYSGGMKSGNDGRCGWRTAENTSNMKGN